MWRKQEEPKNTPDAREVIATPARDAQAAPSAPVAPISTDSPARAAVITATAPQSPALPDLRPAAITGRISTTMVIKGEITGQEDLFIDGDVQGRIRIDNGRITIGPNGRVTADIVAREITVQGHVKGNLHGSERVQIGQTGCARGNVITRRISVDDGAEIHGDVEIIPLETSVQEPSFTRHDSAAVTPKLAATVIVTDESPTIA